MAASLANHESKYGIGEQIRNDECGRPLRVLNVAARTLKRVPYSVFRFGFGFASVLRELNLPAHALGWSLFAFNLGVEFGQVCIVISIAPLLALSYKRSRLLGWRVASVASLAVIVMGAFWFVQRVAS